METLYDLIGARPEDDAENLKKAYRQAAKANHPDHHADDPEAVTRFVRITAAYDILRDTVQRAAYDRTLESARDPRQATSKHAASRRKRSFVSNVIASAAVALMLGGGFMLFADISRISIEDVDSHTAPEPDDAAAVQPVNLAAAPQMPDMVARPGVVTLTANDRVAAEVSRETKADTALGPTGPTIDVSQHDVDVAGRINALSAAERHSGVPTTSGSRVAASGTRRDTRSDIRTDTRKRDAASAKAGDGRSQAAPRRPAADRSAVEQATLEGSNGCTGAQSCPADVPPAVGF